ncbi:metabolite traffic protein EboE [Flagellimonas algicola]|uniref:Xylose isomerase n=1 Tax=Flagellimonas algicola TaxID=2583815 RepID=A0ABY2WNG0_9FLAO|nr:metabolite traffic protein EboE [Allomuricauda algicola]TMU56538.1 xylose isomerase [Allomuricauda algicola]
MQIEQNAHLTYCTNIHPGESWEEVFASLQTYGLEVKNKVSNNQAFGIGLRLSRRSAEELIQGNQLDHFKSWLDAHNLYVFTMNGFPYGDFHHVTVKDQVHTPDWTTADRVVYTKSLVKILAHLLPEGMEGGISTSPLSYKYWFKTNEQIEEVKNKATLSLMSVVEDLVRIKNQQGKTIHIDIEPEPDGVLENTQEVISFYQDHLLKTGVVVLQEKLKCSQSDARKHILDHIQICYDVCHFSLAYEEPKDVMAQFQEQGIKVGKIQISAALKSRRSPDISIKEQQDCLQQFDEPVYLHQAVVQREDGNLDRYPDLQEGIHAMTSENFKELRAHFHIPIFIPDFQVLESTQNDIVKALKLWQEISYSSHLEVETYTWTILPEHLQTDITSSIVRELQWVLKQLES